MAETKIPPELKYTKDHEWLRLAGKVATVGITDHAQDALGDIVYVELPKPGAVFRQRAAFAVIESVKAAADGYLPVSGKVVEVNAALAKSPQLVNSDPYGAGWLAKIEVAAPAELAGLLDARGYAALLAGQKK